MSLRRTLIVINLLMLGTVVSMLTLPLPGTDGDGVAGDATGHPGSAEYSARETGMGSLPAPGEEDYDALVERDLFGVIAREQQQRRRDEQQQEPPRAESADSLELNLLGTIAGGSGLARAIIQPEDHSRQGIYRTGDRVMGAEIVDISRKKVLLSRDGTLYELTMDMTRRVEVGGKDVILAADEFRDVVRAGEDGVVEVDRRELLERGGGMFAMLRELQENLRAEPYREGGETVGLKLAGVESIGVAQLAGIEEGDVLRSVNGHAISSVPQAMQMFRRVRHLEDMDVTIQRDGATVEMSYRLK